MTAAGLRSIVLLLWGAVACTGSAADAPTAVGGPTQTARPTRTATPTRTASPADVRSASPSPTATEPVAEPTASPDPERAAMFADVEAIAAFGPREATSQAYARAAALPESRLEELGYRVRRQALRVPAGVSWGVPVDAGETFNVIAEPRDFDPVAPHLIVGAHLDTVPQSPGANDNASGVAVLLELARLASLEPPAVPVVFIAFAAEEPRGPGDDDHHYGSRAYVEDLDGSAPLAMMSLDRVGIGRRVRVCTGGLGTDAFARFIRAHASAVGVDAPACRNRASDHWPFEKAGFPAVRLLGADDPDYHTPRDQPDVVRPVQLLRTARLAWETLQRVQAADLRR